MHGPVQQADIASELCHLTGSFDKFCAAAVVYELTCFGTAFGAVAESCCGAAKVPL